ncbi:hypothetical protein ACFSKU_05555 [Pontibacter silvestris]|uniref:Outer membrane protein beta-barrel domain-containing protein n=1 Tax=Pontibacter silvestris TaxID=2305183 RepID=A0ABW4WWV2_9BACT|nr:hypothetical protein [Pontibacter silvestris]MCC9137003.1 hypothetical protein [Pontibacter silvestris]
MKTWKRLALPFNLLLLCPLCIQAQSNYKPGYVVTTAGDTLNGFIDYKEWVQNPASISFSPAEEGGAKQVFDATTASYFEINAMEAYQRYEGPVTMNPVKLEELNHTSTTEVDTMTVFLKLREKGKNMNFLSYTDKLKTRYFVQENNGGEPVELYYRRYYSSASGHAQLMTQKIYIGQLVVLAAKYGVPGLKRAIEKADYKDYDLNDIVSLLNGSTTSEIAAANKQIKNSRFYAGIALSRNVAVIEGKHPMSNVDKNSARFSPRITAGVDIFVNRHVQKMLLRIEATAATASSTLAKKESFYSSGSTSYTYKVSQQSIGLGPQLIYNLYNKDNFKLYVGLGAGIYYSHISDNTYTRQHENPSVSYEYKPTIYEDYFDIKPFWVAYTLRSGIILNKKYELSAIYMPPATVTQYVNYALRFSAATLGVNYLFSR